MIITGSSDGVVRVSGFNNLVIMQMLIVYSKYLYFQWCTLRESVQYNRPRGGRTQLTLLTFVNNCNDSEILVHAHLHGGQKE